MTRKIGSDNDFEKKYKINGMKSFRKGVKYGSEQAARLHSQDNLSWIEQYPNDEHAKAEVLGIANKQLSYIKEGYKSDRGKGYQMTHDIVRAYDALGRYPIWVKKRLSAYANSYVEKHPEVDKKAFHHIDCFLKHLSHKKKNLEKSFAFFFGILAIMIALFSFSFNFPGMAITYPHIIVQNKNALGIVFLLTGIVGFFFAFNKR